MMEIGPGCNSRSYSQSNVSESIRADPPTRSQWGPSILARVKDKDTCDDETDLMTWEG
jgi:hypothetical protein